MSKPPDKKSGGSSGRRHKSSSSSGQVKGPIRHSRNNPLKARSDFICRIKYTNELPDVPHDLKLLQYPFDPMRYIRRGTQETSLEKDYMRNAPMLAEPDMGVHINLIDPDVYAMKAGAASKLHPLDRELVDGQYVDEEANAPAKAHVFKGPMPWLMSTQYVDPVAKATSSTSGWEGGQSHEFDASQDDPDSRLGEVVKTFEDANTSEELQHSSNPKLTMEEVIPLFPDFERWGYSIVHAAFDENPLSNTRPQGMSHKGKVPDLQLQPKGAIIQGLNDEQGNQWMAYFLPKKKAEAAAAAADASESGDDATEYTRLRSYSFERRPTHTDKVATSLLWRSETGHMCYKNADSFFRLKKRTKIEGSDHDTFEPDKLIVRRRPALEEELDPVRESLSKIDPDEADGQDDADGGAAEAEATSHVAEPAAASQAADDDDDDDDDVDV